MKCPSCGNVLATPEPRCPHCKLSLQRLDIKFGTVPRHSRYLSDRSGRLALNEMHALRGALRRFEKKFPQVLLSVFVGELARGASVSEYAFWLANRARFSSVHKTYADNFDMLLVIDVVGKAASLTTGYGLERHIAEEDLQAALDEISPRLRHGRIAEGIRGCVQFLADRLRDISRQARESRSPETATRE